MAGIARYADLEDRHILVTGGGSGIGATIVEQFAAQGARVSFIDIAVEPSQALAARHGNVAFHEADLTDIPAVRSAIAAAREQFGPVGGVVNNAAHDQRHEIEDVTVEYWDGRMAVNLRHQFFVVQAVADDLKSDAGTIVNMGSTSWMLGHGGMVAYTAAKSAVLGLTRSLARDLGPHGVRANSIAPGWIMTERQKEKWVTPEALEETLERQCLKRELEPEDVTGLVLFLSSSASGGCTAQSFVCDGGIV